MSDLQTLVRKLWSNCDALRDCGLSYGGYVEQLTSLPFLDSARCCKGKKQMSDRRILVRKL